MHHAVPAASASLTASKVRIRAAPNVLAEAMTRLHQLLGFLISAVSVLPKAAVLPDGPVLYGLPSISVQDSFFLSICKTEFMSFLVCSQQPKPAKTRHIAEADYRIRTGICQIRDIAVPGKEYFAYARVPSPENGPALRVLKQIILFAPLPRKPAFSDFARSTI